MFCINGKQPRTVVYVQLKLTLHITHLRASAFHLLATFVIHFWLPAASSPHIQAQSLCTDREKFMHRRCQNQTGMFRSCSDTRKKGAGFSFVVGRQGSETELLALGSASSSELVVVYTVTGILVRGRDV